MFQSKLRKVPPANGKAVPHSAQTLDDTVTEPKPQNQRKSKYNIPKSVRYDLENALLGLCDVWFEDIKPHLLRNNIKVHVQNNAHATAEAAGGDHQRMLSRDSTADDCRRQPPIDSVCQHIDPASTASGCELCRLLFNAANSIESAVSQAANVIALTASASSAAVPDSPQFNNAETK